MTASSTIGSSGNGRQHLTALRRLGAGMCFAVAIGGALAELTLAWVWLAPSTVSAYVVPHLNLGSTAVSTDGTTRALGFAVSMVPLSLLFYALHQSYEVFDSYRRGLTFSTDVPVRLRRIGLCMLALALVRPLANTVLGLVLTASNPPGQRILAVGLSIDDVMIAIFGGLVVAIGYALTEAARMADDHRQII